MDRGFGLSKMALAFHRHNATVRRSTKRQGQKTSVRSQTLITGVEVEAMDEGVLDLIHVG